MTKKRRAQGMRMNLALFTILFPEAAILLVSDGDRDFSSAWQKGPLGTRLPCLQILWHSRGTAVYLLITDLRLHIGSLRTVWRFPANSCHYARNISLNDVTLKYREKHRTQTHLWLLLGCKIELIKLQAEARKSACGTRHRPKSCLSKIFFVPRKAS